MADRKIIHLRLGGNDYYFGSVAAIYSKFTKEELGVSYGSLRNYGITPDKPYSNAKVTIKEGTLISAKGMRGRKAANGESSDETETEAQAQSQSQSQTQP